MKWLPGGWQRADREWSTSSRRTTPMTRRTAPMGQSDNGQVAEAAATRHVSPRHPEAPAEQTRWVDSGGTSEATRHVASRQPPHREVPHREAPHREVPHPAEPQRAPEAHRPIEPFRPAQPPRPVEPQRPAEPTGLGVDARDVDVSASSFRLLLFGGGLSGLVAVLCAASLVNGAGPWTWCFQLLSGVAFGWFVVSARGMLAGRGFLFDRSGFYVRTMGEIYGVPWSEIKATGIGALPWVENKRVAHPERRRALEFFPTDPGFPDRHPEFERWLVSEPAPLEGLPDLRYRFHLPPLSRLPRQLESAVQVVAPRTWVGQYRRQHMVDEPEETGTR